MDIPAVFVKLGRKKESKQERKANNISIYVYVKYAHI